MQRLCPQRQSSSSAPGRLKFRCEQGGFLTLLGKDLSLSLPGEGRKVKGWWEQRAREVWAVPVELGSSSVPVLSLWALGRFRELLLLRPHGAVPVLLLPLCQSQCFSELAWSSLVLLSGRIASITKTNPPFLPVVIS